MVAYLYPTFIVKVTLVLIFIIFLPTTLVLLKKPSIVCILTCRMYSHCACALRYAEAMATSRSSDELRSAIERARSLGVDVAALRKAANQLVQFEQRARAWEAFQGALEDQRRAWIDGQPTKD